MQNFIAEVSVEPKISFDLQNSQNIKNSNISKSSISFSDFLAEAKAENEVSNKKTENNQPKVENKQEKIQEKTDATEKVSDKTEEKKVAKEETNSEEKAEVVKKEINSNEKLVNANEKKKVSAEKTGEKKSSGNIASKNTDNSKKIDEKKKVNSEEIKKAVRFENKTEEKIASKDEKLKANKKLAQDFRRLEELSEKKIEDEPVESLISYVPVKNENVKEQKIEVKSENFSELNEISEINNNSGDENLLFERLNSEKISYLDDEGKIVVKDQRTEIVEEEVSEKDTKNFTTSIEFENKNTATITMDLNTNTNTVQSDVLSLNNQVAASDGSNFQAMLNNQIQANIPEFVKTGSIILKDNNQGSINLVLHPDDLGNVKISLSLDGKSVSGHIIVNTKEALEVFKDNAQDLREAFIKNGFDAANFDVSYNDNSSNNQNNDFNNQFGRDEFFARRIYSGGQADTVQEFSGIENLNEKFSEYSINIVA